MKYSRRLITGGDYLAQGPTGAIALTVDVHWTWAEGEPGSLLGKGWMFDKIEAYNEKGNAKLTLQQEEEVIELFRPKGTK